VRHQPLSHRAARQQRLQIAWRRGGTAVRLAGDDGRRLCAWCGCLLFATRICDYTRRAGARQHSKAASLWRYPGRLRRGMVAISLACRSIRHASRWHRALASPRLFLIGSCISWLKPSGAMTWRFRGDVAQLRCRLLLYACSYGIRRHGGGDGRMKLLRTSAYARAAEENRQDAERLLA